jgi:Domain of Unknown Function (DUF1080)/PA14 domain
MSFYIKFLFGAALCIVASPTFAQSGLTKLIPNSFKIAENWKVYESVQMHPFKADATQKLPLYSETEGVLLGSVGAPATVRLESGDVLLQFEFAISKDGNSTITLPGGYVIKLADSWQQVGTKNTTSGSIGANIPTQNASKASGLWQKARLLIRKSRPTAVAQLEYLYLNDILVQENVFLPPSDNSNALSFQAQAGTVAIQKVLYQIQNEVKPVAIGAMSYQLYKGWAENIESIDPKNLVKKDTTSTLTQAWGIGQKDFCVVYEGVITADKTADYEFSMAYMGHLSFEIDGKLVLPNQWNEFSQQPVVRSVNLSEGKHLFKLFYHKAWRPAALGLTVSASGVRPYPLHALSSLPEPEPIPMISVTPKDKPEMVRSFVQIEGEKSKRTHVLSVGSPQGLHYSVDLDQAALLQVWRGAFADVTEMWHERGEPQLLKPLGVTQRFIGKSNMAILNEPTALWPDSVAAINFKGIELDDAGTPALHYQFDKTDITQKIIPTRNGLVNSIKSANVSTDLTVRIAVADAIIEIERGIYSIDNQQYYIYIPIEFLPVVRTSNGKQELIVPLKEIVTYTIAW